MNKLLLLAVGAVLLSCSIGLAQDADSDLSYVLPPQPPYVARTAQKSAWTIELIPNTDSNVPAPTGTSTAPKPDAKQLKQQDWTKSNGLMKCINEWSDGTTSEDWVVGAMKLSQDSVHNGIHLYNPKSDPRYHDFTSSDFEKLDWITAKSYDHAVKHGGEICYLFTSKSTAANGIAMEAGAHNKTLSEINAPNSPTSVFISVQSKLPLEIDNGDGKYIYHYLPPPTDDLKLPEAFITLLKAYRGH